MAHTDPRYIEAMRAEALCKARKFQLCGKVLFPFSVRHALQLAAYGNALWVPQDRPADGLDLLMAAEICSSPEFLAELPAVQDVSGLDPEAEVNAWRDYVAACYGTKPEIRRSGIDDGSPFRTPDEEYVIAYILRNSHGYTREVLETVAMAKLHWIFECLSEQISGKSMVIHPLEKAQIAAASTPEAMADAKRREKIAAEIDKLFSGNRRKRLELLKALDAGTLPRDWKKTAKRARMGR